MIEYSTFKKKLMVVLIILKIMITVATIVLLYVIGTVCIIGLGLAIMMIETNM